ncbi:nicastrin-like [Babylonia areolata]|uniref:nicastrin-like n=1 Tax=Babylonia areolata TaxID=304850 RepID=UPI003FCF5493
MAAFKRRTFVMLWKIYLLVLCFCTVTSKRIKEKIYIDIVSENGCFRLLNGTHQIGCTSEQEGNTGVVHYLLTEKDWTYVLTTGDTGPYIPVLHALNFTTENVRRLVRSGRVNGIAVINLDLDTKDIQAGFSVDKSADFSLYHGTSQGDCKDVRWNAAGDGLFFDDISIPIFSIYDRDDVDTILKKCWERFNKPLVSGEYPTYPLCAMELVSPMAAAKDTKTCVRRSNLVTNLSPMMYCDPLGDKNIVATLKAVPSDQPRRDKSVIVVATRMDSMGMFYNQFPASDTSVTGIVTLLATAKTLWKLQQEIISNDSSSDIMFTFLQGEAFDYIGSSRMVYDMQRGRFPVADDNGGSVNLQKITLSHIAQFVELSQVGMRQDGDSLWLHTDPNVRKKTEVQALLTRLTKLGAETNTTFQTPDPGAPLPPASVQWFLKEAGASPFPSFVVTDHEKSFTNKYYNSHWDLPSKVKWDHPPGLNSTEWYDTDTVLSSRITRLATALARYLFWAAMGRDPTSDEAKVLQADIKDVNHMLYCYLHSPHCELFNFTVSPDNADALNQNVKPFPFYVTVDTMTNQVTYLTQRILALFTGKVVANATHSQCAVQGGDKRYTYMWMQGAMVPQTGQRSHVCYKSTALLTTAQSPAFDIDDYDWGSGKYSTWTESRWTDFKVRVFLMPSKQFQTQLLSAGVVIFVISLVVVYWVNAKAAVLFSTRGTSREYLFEYST